jgi:hypothetical protein
VGCKRGHDGLPTPYHDLFGMNDDGEYVCNHSAFWIAKGGETNGPWLEILKVCRRLSLKKVDRICAG